MKLLATLFFLLFLFPAVGFADDLQYEARCGYIYRDDAQIDECIRILKAADFREDRARDEALRLRLEAAERQLERQRAHELELARIQAMGLFLFGGGPLPCGGLVLARPGC